MLTRETASGLISGPGAISKEKRMAKVKILSGVVASGFDCRAGETYELDESDAAQLIAMGKAVPVAAATKKKTTSRESDAPKTTKRSKS